MAAPTIKTGLDTTNPMVFAKTRHGYLIGVNGIDRGIFWDGRTEDSCSELGMDAPANPPTVLTPSTAQKPATATITFDESGHTYPADLDEDTIAITDGYGRTVTYTLDDDTALDYIGAYTSDNNCRVGIASQDTASKAAKALMYAIRGPYGHDGSIIVSENGSGVLTLTQLEGGTAGNTSITASATGVTATNFTLGANTARGSYATIEVKTGTPANLDGETIQLISYNSDGTTTSITYTWDDDASPDADAAPDVRIQGDSSASVIAGRLKDSITDTTGGHGGKLEVYQDGATLVVYQSVPGPGGDTTVTENSDPAHLTATSFTNGTNVDGCTGGDYTCFYRYVDEREGVKFYSNLSPFQVVTATADDTFLWKDLTASGQSRATHVQLLRTSFNQATTAYVVATLKHNGTFSAVADSGTAVFTAPKGHGLVQGMRIVVSGSTNHNLTWEVSSVASASATADSVTMTTGIGSPQTAAMTWKLEGYTEDKLTDGQIVLFRGDFRQKLLQADGRPAANRHAPPPCFKSVCCAFQDRMTYLVDPIYTTGQVSQYTANSTSVVGNTAGGNATGWTDHLVGRLFCPDPDDNNNTYIIESVNEGTQTITLDKGYLGSTATNKTYTIINPPEERNTIYISEQDLPESVITQIAIQENVRDEDELVGAIVMGAQYYALKEHSIYRVTWAKNPLLDAQPQLAAMRGAINHNCADQHENILYIMDEEGPYAFQGNGVQPIGTPVADQWSDQLLDFSKKSTWSVRVDPLEELVYFFVTGVGDSGDRPRRALVYDIRTQTWSKWTYSWDVGDSVKLTHGNQRRLLMGVTNDSFYVCNEGLKDGTSNIEYGWKSGMFSWVESDQGTQRYFRVTFKPTTNDATMNIKKYDNHSTSPVAMNEWDGGDGVSIVQDATQAVADLKLSQHADGDEPGSKVLPWSGKLPLLRGRPVRWVTCEITGEQSEDRIIIYEIEIGGVK